MFITSASEFPGFIFVIVYEGLHTFIYVYMNKPKTAYKNKTLNKSGSEKDIVYLVSVCYFLDLWFRIIILRFVSV